MAAHAAVPRAQLRKRARMVTTVSVEVELVEMVVPPSTSKRSPRTTTRVQPQCPLDPSSSGTLPVLLDALSDPKVSI